MPAKKERVALYLTIKRNGVTLMEQIVYGPIHPCELVLEADEYLAQASANLMKTFSHMIDRFEKKCVTDKQREEFDAQWEKILSQE
jgi:hypothetical protein